MVKLVPFSIMEIQEKIGYNLHKFPKDVSLDQQWLDLLKKNEPILSGCQVTQSLLSTVRKDIL